MIKRIDVIKAPNIKVAATNLNKLAPERKLVQIQIDVKLAPDLTFRDQFDWDLSTVKIRPHDFARELLQ